MFLLPVIMKKPVLCPTAAYDRKLHKKTIHLFDLKLIEKIHRNKLIRNV